MAQEDLVPLNERTKDEQKKIRSAGGKASGKARREKAMLREAADLLLSRRLPPGEHEELLAALGIPKTDHTHALLATLGMVVEAEKGNPAAFKRLMELRGEGTETHTVELSGQGQLASLLEDRQKRRDSS
jgi:hypothetical protein